MLAGSRCGRYSSTHRVAVTAADTWEYIERRCAAALEQPTPAFYGAGTGARESVEVLRESISTCEVAHSEVEFEWLRQWGTQGQAHVDTHAFL